MAGAVCGSLAGISRGAETGPFRGGCVVMLAGLQLFASAERARGPAVEPRWHGWVGAQRRARRRWPCMAAPKDGADMKRSALGTCTGISHLAGVRHVRLCVLDLTSKNLRENEPARQVCRTNGAGSPAACRCGLPLRGFRLADSKPPGARRSATDVGRLASFLLRVRSAQQP